MARKPVLSRYLKDARIKRGLSLAEVAERAGVSGPSVYFWEMGRNDADASWVRRVPTLPFPPTKLKLVDIKRAVRATLKERAANLAE